MRKIVPRLNYNHGICGRQLNLRECLSLFNEVPAVDMKELSVNLITKIIGGSAVKLAKVIKSVTLNNKYTYQ